MPSLTTQKTPRYVPVHPTTENLDYADLPVIDISKSITPEGRAALAIQVRDAMTEHGFFYVINHGYTAAQAERMFEIADVPFAYVTPDEKQSYTGSAKDAVSESYQGYKPRQYWHIDGGVHDQVEHYNINRDVTVREHPVPLRPFLPEIAAFAEHNHFNVLHPVLRLLALGLGLPEDRFVDCHRFSSTGETSVRFMKYYPRSEDEEEKSKNVWLKGHTDIGTMTLLWSQPIAALQILSRDGSWKWVKHIENALVINAGDGMEFLSGGLYRATIHRVIQPPQDQRGYERLGVFYFCFADDDTKLAPQIDSPVLKRVGITRRFEDEDAPTMAQWRKGRTSVYGLSELKPAAEKGVEEEIVEGIVVKHYN